MSEQNASTCDHDSVTAPEPLFATPHVGEREGPVAWCPIDRNGYLYVEHANAVRHLVETEVQELNALPTTTAPADSMARAQPFRVIPLYARYSHISVTAPVRLMFATPSDVDALMARVEATALSIAWGTSGSQPDDGARAWAEQFVTMPRADLRALLAALREARVDTHATIEDADEALTPFREALVEQADHPAFITVPRDALEAAVRVLTALVGGTR